MHDHITQKGQLVWK